MNKKIVNLILCLACVFAVFPSSASAASGSDIVNEARKHIGKPYSTPNRLGPDAFDCSGLVWYVCNAVGIEMSSGNAESQKSYGTAVDHSALKNYDDCSDLQAGDLIFFDYDGDGITNHVAIYSENGYAIHALSKGVQETPLSWTTGVVSGQRFYQAVIAVRRVADGEVTVSAEIEESKNAYRIFSNIDNIEKSAVYIAASYDSNGKLLEIAHTETKNGEESAVTLQKYSEIEYIKVFVWENLENLVPLTTSEKIYV